MRVCGRTLNFTLYYTVTPVMIIKKSYAVIYGKLDCPYPKNSELFGNSAARADGSRRRIQ